MSQSIILYQKPHHRAAYHSHGAPRLCRAGPALIYVAVLSQTCNLKGICFFICTKVVGVTRKKNCLSLWALLSIFLLLCAQHADSEDLGSIRRGPSLPGVLCFNTADDRGECLWADLGVTVVFLCSYV